MVSLHIISKDLPQWTWATFENKRNFKLPEAEKNHITKSIDIYGVTQDGKISNALMSDFEKHGLSKKWQNYILSGTQTAYTDFKGNPTQLANTYTEDGFVKTSSCITCHSKATIGAKLDFNDLPRAIQDTIKYSKNQKKVLKASHFVNRLPIFKIDTKDTTVADNGIPNPEWYEDKVENHTYRTKRINSLILHISHLTRVSAENKKRNSASVLQNSAGVAPRRIELIKEIATIQFKNLPWSTKKH